MVLLGCGDDATTPSSASGSGAGGAFSGSASTASGMTSSSSTSSSSSSATTSSATSGAGGGGLGYSVTTSVITSDHRFIDGAMFGGWGPHLGHLVTDTAGTAYFVDDVCAQSPGGPLALCDVLDNHTLGYFWREPAGWKLVSTVGLPGTVQQNTATIVSSDGASLSTFGIDVATNHIVECAFPLPVGPPSCNALPFVLGPSSNYIGAAISPAGYRMVWWTGVVDGGGGSFHYIVDYGGGWNGPRSGTAAGYNDASYIHVGFPTDAPARFVMHAQLVSGLAPNWSFFGAVGTGDLTTSDPVAFTLPLADIGGADPVVSTDDVWVDPVTQDEHLLARTDAGAAAYFHRPPGGSWSAASFVLPSTFRARFVPHGDRLALVSGPNGSGLAVRVAGPADRVSGAPIDWRGIPAFQPSLPPGYDNVYAIYPAGPPYRRGSADDIEIAVVGADRQYEVLGVHLAPSL